MNKTDYVPTFFAPMVSLYLIYAGEVAWEGVVFQTRFKETSTGISSTNIIWQRDMDTRMVRGLLSQRRIYRVLLNSIRYFLTFNKIFSKCFRVLPRWIRLSWNNRRKWMVLYSFNITNSTKWGNTRCNELEEGYHLGRQLCSSRLMGSSIAWTRTNRKYGPNENGWCFGSSYC